jgi:hypothetical protein
LNDLGACIPEYGDGLNGPIFEKRINGEITTSLKSVVSVGGHRKERGRDTLLRQVGSLTGKWHFFKEFIDKYSVCVSQTPGKAAGCRYIAETCNSVPGTGIDNITSFQGS